MRHGAFVGFRANNVSDATDTLSREASQAFIRLTIYCDILEIPGNGNSI